MNKLGDFPEYLASAFPGELLSRLRSTLVDAMAVPPYEGRSRSSKSFSFLLASGGGAGNAAEALIDGFTNGPLHRRAIDLFASGYLFLLDNCSVGRHIADEAGSSIAMHYDGMFLGLPPAANFWVPLDDVGTTIPGLSFVSNKQLDAAVWDRYCSMRQSDGWQVADPSVLDRLMPQQAKDRLATLTYTPQVRAGDCLLFDSGTLHATQSLSRWSGDRVSIEFRICGVGAVPGLYTRREHRLARVVERSGRLGVVYEERPETV